MSSGIELIAAERKRQIEVEGWTSEHDDSHTRGQIAAAAECYADAARLQICFPGQDWSKGIEAGRWWPWSVSWWKPSTDPIRNLEKAGALIAAEIDRLLRAKERG